VSSSSTKTSTSTGTTGNNHSLTKKVLSSKKKQKFEQRNHDGSGFFYQGHRDKFSFLWWLFLRHFQSLDQVRIVLSIVQLLLSIIIIIIVHGSSSDMVWTCGQGQWTND
jgi:hypothetical protein